MGIPPGKCKASPMNVSPINWKDGEYQDLLQHDRDAFLYHSPFWLEILEKTLQVQIHVLGCRRKGRLAAAFPYAISKVGPLGPVINSLPFFGSIGGMIHNGDPDAARTALLLLAGALLDEATRIDAASMTVIDRPGDPFSETYKKALDPTFTDSRTTYYSYLPIPSSVSEERILSSFAGRTRTAIRKAQKLNYTVEKSLSEVDFNEFLMIHQENMREANGIAKPLNFMKTTFEAQDQDRRELWVAKKDGRLAAGALFFSYANTAEYYMAALSASHRTFQPLSLILFEAMKSFSYRGVNRFNFGGTWTSQQGLRKFKSSWGTTAVEYHYYVRIFKKDLIHWDARALVQAYPFFYTIPFHCLGKKL